MTWNIPPGNVVRVSTRRWAEMQGYNPKKLFTKLFKEDIEYLLSMKDLWEKRGRLPPNPLLWDNLPDAGLYSLVSLFLAFVILQTDLHAVKSARHQ